MCKYPAPECRPVEEDAPEDNETAEEDNATSEDDDEASDSDESYYTESSVNLRSDSESDAESASGNRVTPDMVLLLMLKEHGAISEEKYAEKSEICDKNFKSVIPKLPRSFSVDSFDYTKELCEVEDFSDEDSENNDNKDITEKVEVNNDNKDTVEMSNTSEIGCDKDVVKDRKDIEFIEKVNDVKESDPCDILKSDTNEPVDDINKFYVLKNDTNMSVDDISKCDMLKNDTNMSIDDISTNHCNEETTSLQQQETNTKNKDNESKEVEENSQQDHKLEVNKEERQKAVREASKIESESCIVPECVNTEPTLSKDDDVSQIPGDDKGIKPKNLLNGNDLELAEDKTKETNNNINQDTTKQEVLTKSEEECKIENRNSKTEPNLPTGKITKSFKYILRKLIREKRIPKEDEVDRISDDYGEDYASHLWSYADRLDSDYENNTAIDLSDESDDDNCSLREFAFYLNFYSPSSYKHILETYNTPLPPLKVLYSWYLKDDNEPGLSERAFKILKEKSSVKRQTCTLMFIDIFLKNDGKYCDQVNYGGEENTDFPDKAVLAYVFVLVSLDQDWKMPIGYIFARNIPAETQAEYIRICLTHCHDAGADVVAVTLETLTPAESLGCSFQDIKNLKTVFKHPSCDREVAVWIDPCLALKSARQTLKVKGVLKDDEDNKIRWNLIRKLRRLHTDDSTDLEQSEFFELRNHIAKIGLTSEIFSKNLIPALELGEKLLPDMFTDTEPTKRYIAFINMLYNILNSRVTTRMRRIAWQLHVGKKYLIRLFRNEENNLSPLDRENLSWKRVNGYRFFLKGEQACGFIGFLICIESFKHLYTTLVKKERRIDYLNPQRLCKGQAEDLVTNLRAYDWSDPERFTGDCFKRFYDRLFDQLEKNPQFTDKTIPLEHWPLQNRFPPAVTIKLTSGKRSYDDVYSGQYKLKKLRKTTEEDRATKLVREYSKAMDTETDLSIRKNMVGFLAGWIAARFAKCLKCEACIDSLCANKKLWFHKFITLKRIYALCLPSEEIFRICWECERALRMRGSPGRFHAWVLRRLAPKFPWSSQKRSHPLAHHIHLARAVITKYIALRIPAPFSTKDRNKIVEMFQRFTKKDPDDPYDELAEWLDGSIEEESDSE